MKIHWKEVTRKLEELKPLEYNPRNITEKGLKDLKTSINKFGLAEPIVVNVDNTIIGGHARYYALKEQGETECQCYIPSRKLSKKEVDELNIRLNKNIAGEWDFDLLANEFELDDLLDWGFEENELLNIINYDTTQDDIPEVPKKTDIQVGDLFVLGDHKLLCGDSTKKENVERLLFGENPDIIFTDPPYDMDYNLVEKCFENINGIGKVQFWMGSDKQVTKLASKFEKQFTHYFIHDFVNATMINSFMPMTQHTLIAKFRNKKIKNLKDGFSTIIKVQTNRIKKEHEIFNMGKDVELPSQFIKHYCDKGVLDLFGGYGSTLIAAEQLGKKCLMIEINPYLCDLIIQRWENLTKRKATLTKS